jgi:S-methylmethionine-dependent homocysteine/selenocysteine methylase
MICSPLTTIKDKKALKMDKAKIEEVLDQLIDTRKKFTEIELEASLLAQQLKLYFSATPNLEFFYKKYRFYFDEDADLLGIELLPSFDEIPHTEV